ncbi:hypothetical protein DID75_00870 [Candidatus Marinamargulisbacteria bacterium SCGC AG-410-N11]|nr:hypothetical protein DID75_00870 [Candidatus Marinamargulisbacteria bacterium SCGC AG-410-N11]
MTTLSLLKLKSLVNKDLQEINATIDEQVLEAAPDNAKQIFHYILKHRGKQLRPILLLLICYAIKPNISPDSKTNIVLVAAAIELIHVASLIHDDLIDDAKERRGQESVNSKWGKEIAITTGVYFYSNALCLISKTGSSKILESLSKAVKLMCASEISQFNHRYQFVSEQDNHYVVHGKTAALFETTCECATYLLNTSDYDQILKFGTNMGYLLQLSDDYMDVMSDGDQLKKSIGQDIHSGQYTLPIILLFNKLNAEDQAKLKKALLQGTKSLNILKTYFTKYNIAEDIKQKLLHYYQSGKQSLEMLEPSIYKDQLDTIITYTYHRAFQ